MKVTQVALRPTEASLEANRPSLTPELLAATGARYSRSNEGLEKILAKIDPNNLDKSVDSIFRMIDYGHQSIADMVPVTMFIDGVSIWLAYYVWALCPTAGGQESSTRFIRISPSSLTDHEFLGIPRTLLAEWHRAMVKCFSCYERALTMWDILAARDPKLVRIPTAMYDDQSESSMKKVARMQRNYAFDRARYYLPAATATNIMLIMSARGWIQLCQHLCSHLLLEARHLGAMIRRELAVSAPRMIKHAREDPALQKGIQSEFDEVRKMAGSKPPEFLRESSKRSDHPATASLEVACPPGVFEDQLVADLRFHDNRYAWVGNGLRRVAVRFSWAGVAFGEIRDLNRHRTGNKFCPMLPVGFYSALDQVPQSETSGIEGQSLLRMNKHGRSLSARAHELLRAGDPTYVFWTMLGTQFPFEHLTTGDKFIYEAELRTGVGAHFRYAQHLRDALALWYKRYPDSKGLILEGSAEPE
jgi:thymidylate synthase ThyX